MVPEELHQLATGQNCTPAVVMHRRIRMVRKFRRLSQEHLANRTGINAATISAYERFRFPPANHLRLICDALGVSADFLIGRQPHVDQDRDQCAPISHPHAATLVAMRITNMDGKPIWEKIPKKLFSKS
jgi:DNA-binding XRE family transcriptional regulator